MPFSMSSLPLTCPSCASHCGDLTPSGARLLALDLVQRADEAEGRRGLPGFVTRWEVLAELETLRREVIELRARVTAQLDEFA